MRPVRAKGSFRSSTLTLVSSVPITFDPGLSMPTTALLDRLIPPDLTQFDLSDILPNIAGLDLSSLFDGVYMPAAAQDNIVISHHIDPQKSHSAVPAFFIPLNLRILSDWACSTRRSGCETRRSR